MYYVELCKPIETLSHISSFEIRLQIKFHTSHSYNVTESIDLNSLK